MCTVEVSQNLFKCHNNCFTQFFSTTVPLVRPEIFSDVITQFHFIGLKKRIKEKSIIKWFSFKWNATLFSPQKWLEKQVQPRTPIVTCHLMRCSLSWFDGLSSSCPLSYTSKNSHDTFVFFFFEVFFLLFFFFSPIQYCENLTTDSFYIWNTDPSSHSSTLVTGP